jgi:hypothetical protein
MTDVKLTDLARELRACRPEDPGELLRDCEYTAAMRQWTAACLAVANALETADDGFDRGWFMWACGD